MPGNWLEVAGFWNSLGAPVPQLFWLTQPSCWLPSPQPDLGGLDLGNF
jgi:hypothetical protein